jgi:hypothetical protein
MMFGKPRWFEDSATIPIWSGCGAACWANVYDWPHPIWLGLAWAFAGLSTRAFIMAFFAAECGRP